MPNKRFEQTNHGHDSKLGSKRGGAVVCSSTAVRTLGGQMASADDGLTLRRRLDTALLSFDRGYGRSHPYGA